MVKEKVEDEKGYPITITDWITFLSSNVNTNVSLTAVLFSSVMMILVVTLQLAITGYLNILSTIIFIIVIAVAVSQFYKGSMASRKYQKLMHRIMIGELTTHEKILKEYNKISVFSKKS